MYRSLPHLTLTTSTSSLSPISSTSPIFPTVSPAQTRSMILDPWLPCDVPRQSGGIITNPISHRFMSFKTVEFKDIDAEAIDPEVLEHRRIETEILGQIRIKSTNDLWEVLLLKLRMNLEKLLQTCLTSSHRCIPTTTRRKASQTRTLRMENYEKCWLHHWKCKVEGVVNPLECQSQRGNLLHCYRREEQVRNVLKLI